MGKALGTGPQGDGGMSRPKAAPAHWPYDHRTVEEVDRQASLRKTALNDLAWEPFEHRVSDWHMREGSSRLLKAIQGARR
jgi:hypothetical protein